MMDIFQNFFKIILKHYLYNSKAKISIKLIYGSESCNSYNNAENFLIELIEFFKEIDNFYKDIKKYLYENNNNINDISNLEKYLLEYFKFHLNNKIDLKKKKNNGIIRRKYNLQEYEKDIKNSKENFKNYLDYFIETNLTLVYFDFIEGNEFDCDTYFEKLHDYDLNILLLFVSTYDNGSFPKNCCKLEETLKDLINDFRVEKDLFKDVFYSCVGYGNKSYGKKYFCSPIIKCDKWLFSLGAKKLYKTLTLCDGENNEDYILDWKCNLFKTLYLSLFFYCFNNIKLFTFIYYPNLKKYDSLKFYCSFFCNNYNQIFENVYNTQNCSNNIKPNEINKNKELHDLKNLIYYHNNKENDSFLNKKDHDKKHINNFNTDENTETNKQICNVYKNEKNSFEEDTCNNYATSNVCKNSKNKLEYNYEESTKIISSESSYDEKDYEKTKNILITNSNHNNKDASINCSSEDELEDLVLNETKDMLTKNQRDKLTKEGYKIIGSHSAVKLCRWSKSQLRGRGGCYKHTFYGINSYQCMEATPSLACANKCVFCWRHHKNPVGVSWKWNKDEAKMIVEEAIKKHKGMIKELKGVYGVIKERFDNAMNIKHCALSLVGEPIMYPDINELIDELHKKNISTFLVTNAQFPDALKNLRKVTQLYLSIDASNKEALKNIDRPLFKDYWERYIKCIKILKNRKERTVFRFTLVKEYNMMANEVSSYAKLIEYGSPDFIEIKAVTYCGTSNGYQLTMKNIPWHEEVYQFAYHLINCKSSLTNIYEICCEHKHSCSILIAKKIFKINNKWFTWINYEKFQYLVKQNKDFNAVDYCAETPEWAIVGSVEKGFNPCDKRVYTKGKNKNRNSNKNQNEYEKKV
ncbi:tRNA-YW synthesizing protein, putative [Plasmodium gallinaceum]|uniref:tRNA 4-demethylwyosine synthase (AdoMet-dependent) n=1 Tax=Plasmodium gallinaceum TaxID=5849 RepID=A0A1J1GPS3_PLAGA|nr:tRNA-YW synthesizing protein, putative [Plasmodium gallinaceum]CRG93018.1 tRNA-YW synthesizing protein, putative [Plasmodium gallinaceum]